ncbi:multiple myeloma tumor-associated protein 2 [Tanacetum coccineum]
MEASKEEIRRIKEEEEQAMRETLGIAPKCAKSQGSKLDKHEFSELIKRGLTANIHLDNNFISKGGKIGTDNQEKDEKQRQNDKTGLGMEKTVKDKAKSKPESQSSQKVNRKVNWSKSKSTQVNPGAKVKEI